MPPTHKKHEPLGPMIAIVVIIIMFALGGVYFFAKKYMEERPPLLQFEQANSI